MVDNRNEVLLRRKFVVAIRELANRQYAAGLAREVLTNFNTERREEPQRQIMNSIDKLLAENKELKKLLEEMAPLMREGAYLVKTLAASQDKLRAWVRYEIENKCAVCWNRDMEPCPTFFCRYKYAKTLLEGASE